MMVAIQRNVCCSRLSTASCQCHAIGPHFCAYQPGKCTNHESKQKVEARVCDDINPEWAPLTCQVMLWRPHFWFWYFCRLTPNHWANSIQILWPVTFHLSQHAYKRSHKSICRKILSQPTEVLKIQKLSSTDVRWMNNTQAKLVPSAIG